MMHYRPLGNTGLTVSEIGMGCEGFFEEDHAMARKLFDAAEKAGVNYFDLYSPDPEMRKAVGEAIRGRREKFIIQGHLCSVWKNGQYLRTRDLKEVRQAFEEMLAILGVSFVDIGMIHYCDSLKDWETILENGILDYAMELKGEGKIRHIGLSSHNPVVALKAVETGKLEVLMFSINPCYDLQPPDEDVEKLWADEAYEKPLLNMDPDRQKLYERCAERGVGITVMKAFGGGDLLDASLSPAGVALTPAQCIGYALSRPAAATICCGVHSVSQLEECVAFEALPAEKRDFAEALASFPKISWKGHCMYCNHCLPCPKAINIAEVTKFYHLAVAEGKLPETVREHYKVLEHHAGDCIQCGACEKRCPFSVPIRDNMKKAREVFGY
jgi:predicted aldo/keto reductase-like oxidoreductase